jgi:hypothetical protein
MRRSPEEQSQARLAAHPYGDCVDELAREPSFVTRAMFGCLACYAHGKLMLVLAGGDPPWDGVLVPTAREHHDPLRAAFPDLRAHPILSKWLYLAASNDGFEREARRLAARARAEDPLIGVEPTARRAAARSRKRSRRR